ncbi:MAG TPA: serine hydrolase, partial [Mycobacteriales bacterium]|nr:serine hydrolase [Mycobacteriales bacterium]
MTSRRRFDRARAALAAASAVAAIPILVGPTVLGAVLAGPAVAAPRESAAPIGGPELGSAGLIVHPTADVPVPPQVDASGWLVADLDTGAVLAAQDPHGRYAPASTLKVLTALVAIPRLDPAGTVTATSEQVDVDGTKVGIVPGHAYTVSMLLHGLLMVSGNDAARVVAGALGGNDVVQGLMNGEAEHLQALDTHAGSVTGLDAPGQTSSAYDLALLARAALKLPAFAEAVATPTYEFSGAGVAPFQISNHNPLLGHYAGTYGVKNGYTNAAQASFIGAA